MALWLGVGLAAGAFGQEQAGFDPDVYEPDNSPEQATSFEYNGEQVHNFHQAGDEDWSMFWIGPDWETYVNVTQLGPNCVPRLQIYLAGNPPELVVDEVSDGGPIYILGHFMYNAVYFIRVTNSNGAFGPGTQYTLGVGGFEGALTPATLTGSVMRHGGGSVPISNASIRVTNLGNMQTSSDNDGVYLFPPLLAQSYSMRASAPGYEDSVRQVNLSGSGINVVNFSLTPVPKAGLSVTPSSQDVTNSAGQAQFAVSNTGDAPLVWSAAVTSGGSWLQLTGGSSGVDAGAISVSYNANTLAFSRLGRVTITAGDADGSPRVVEVRQAGRSIVADVNNDGEVDAVDVQLVINAALGLVNLPQADIDGNGLVTAVDVQLVINAALGAG